MKESQIPRALLCAAVLMACEGVASDGDDATFGPQRYDACTLTGVLDHLNGGVSAETLSMHIQRATAERIVARRDGEDGRYGTEDDRPFTDIEQVNAVPGVGPNVFAALAELPEGACMSVPTRCDDAPELGEAGTISVQRWPLEMAGELSQPITFRLADDVVGVTFTADAGTEETAFDVVTVDGHVVIDLPRTDPSGFGDIQPRRHFRQPSATTMLARAATDPIGLGRCVTLQVGSAAGTVELVTATRRSERANALRLNYVSRGEGFGLLDGERDAVHQTITRLFAASGIEVEPGPEHYAVELGMLDTVEFGSPEARAIRMRSFGDDPLRINLLFAEHLGEDNLLGSAGGIPGAPMQGHASSGVLMALSPFRRMEDGTLDTARLAVTTAHEIGHQLGLFHTSERHGRQHDALEDTPECGPAHDFNDDELLAPAECQDRGASNLMFWAIDENTDLELSATQAEWLQHSPAL